MSMQDINETHEVTDAELDAVSGGWFDFGGYASLLRMIASQERGGGGGGAGGQNDPAQMFAQIMQQMTGG